MHVSELTEIAQHYHDVTISQRITAMNNIFSRLSNEAQCTLSVIDTLSNIDHEEIQKVKLSVADVVKIAENEISRIKREMQIISHCNYCLLQIQPILDDPDLRRYFDFLIMSYRKVTRDVTKFCHVGDLNIAQFIELPDRLRKLPQTPLQKNKKVKKPKSYLQYATTMALVILINFCSYPLLLDF